MEAAWAALHHGIDPRRVPVLHAWLRGMWWLARPLAAVRVPPLAITVVGVVFAVDAVLLASATPWVALALVVLSVVCDGLDGAVALVSDRVSVAGAYADKVADRVSDVAFAAVLWRCGAPWWLATIAGGTALVHEGIRELRGGALRSRLTVAERPSRTVCAALACASSAVSTATWPPTACAAVWVGLGAVGLGQLR